jgi:hypothetical protein
MSFRAYFMIPLSNKENNKVIQHNPQKNILKNNQIMSNNLMPKDFGGLKHMHRH